ncbi:hypothetical protein [Larkinella soli]|uniref:hypothetical protein n=1 Tax=Larkinella soli TaxID=1770527 RepID=UPI000FFBC75F|nr:hypothetical protein [Larkinella soli]
MRHSLFLIDPKADRRHQIQGLLLQLFPKVHVAGFEDLLAMKNHVAMTEQFPSVLLVNLEPDQEAMIARVARLKQMTDWQLVMVIGWAHSLTYPQVRSAYQAGFNSAHNLPTHPGEMTAALKLIVDYWLTVPVLPAIRKTEP